MRSEIMAACTHCGEKHKITAYSSINVAETPELREKVLDGSLFMWECPHCGSLNLIQSQTLYHDPVEKLMIWSTGDSRELETQIATAYSKVEEMADYTARFTADIGSLIEKVKIFASGLDDIVIEMCKYVTKLELRDKDKSHAEEINAAPFKFLKLDGADNEITLAYPVGGEMQMVAIGFNVYEDCRGIVSRNPEVSKAAAGFTRVDAEWLSRFFR